jgi:hypothetical protein
MEIIPLNSAQAGSLKFSPGMVFSLKFSPALTRFPEI